MDHMRNLTVVSGYGAPDRGSYLYEGMSLEEMFTEIARFAEEFNDLNYKVMIALLGGDELDRDPDSLRLRDVMDNILNILAQAMDNYEGNLKIYNVLDDLYDAVEKAGDMVAAVRRSDASGDGRADDLAEDVFYYSKKLIKTLSNGWHKLKRLV